MGTLATQSSGPVDAVLASLEPTSVIHHATEHTFDCGRLSQTGGGVAVTARIENRSMSIETTTKESESDDETETRSNSTMSSETEQHRGEDETSSEDAPEPLPLDTVFEMLRNERRRRVLTFLEREPETTLSDLAEQIAAHENDTTVRALSSQQRKRVYVGLYQCHLPKMDGAGVIDFDEDRGDVVRTPAADQLTPYLDIEPDDEAEDDPVIPAAYLLAVTVGTVAYFLASVQGAPAWMLDGAVGTTLVAVTALALVQSGVFSQQSADTA